MLEETLPDIVRNPLCDLVDQADGNSAYTIPPHRESSDYAGEFLNH